MLRLGYRSTFGPFFASRSLVVGLLTDSSEVWRTQGLLIFDKNQSRLLHLNAFEIKGSSARPRCNHSNSIWAGYFRSCCFKKWSATFESLKNYDQIYSRDQLIDSWVFLSNQNQNKLKSNRKQSHLFINDSNRIQAS